MKKLIKVFNKGKKPIVWSRSTLGIEVIHPGKYDLFSKEKADEIVKKFDDAVLEEKPAPKKGNKKWSR